MQCVWRFTTISKASPRVCVRVFVRERERALQLITPGIIKPWPDASTTVRTQSLLTCVLKVISFASAGLNLNVGKHNCQV